MLAWPYRPHIFFNGTDVTGSQSSVVVGQKISLNCRLVGPSDSPTPPPATNFQWPIQGNAIAGMYVSPDPLQTNGHPAAFSNVTSNQLNFFGVDGGDNLLVECTAQALGQTLKARANFSVKKPTAVLSAWTNATVQVVDGQLVFGSHSFAGISFLGRDKDTSGDCEYIQMGHQLYRYQNAADGKWSRAEGSGLDGEYPNQNSQDKPGTGLTSGGSAVTADVSFTTYLAFRPTSADVLVPIRQINWNWSGTAVYSTNSGWTLQSGSAALDGADSPAASTISWTDAVRRTLDQPPVPEP